MYTTPLSTLISSLSSNHHLCADNTQLFLSFSFFNFTLILHYITFYPSDPDSSITHLQNALQAISSWMSANLLTLQELTFS